MLEVPSRAGIYRILVRHQLIQPGRRRRRRGDWRRWERERPMQLWQLDIVGGIRLADGSELKLVSGLDDHSRFCVIATLVPRATGRAVCAAFAAALARYGVPAEVLTDNGRQFTGRFGKPRPAEVLFDRSCRENAITHRLTGVRSPTTTGKVERFHKTLRGELLASLPPFPSLEVAQKGIDDWVADYNGRRPIRGSAWPPRPPGSRPTSRPAMSWGCGCQPSSARQSQHHGRRWSWSWSCQPVGTSGWPVVSCGWAADMPTLGSGCGRPPGHPPQRRRPAAQDRGLSVHPSRAAPPGPARRPPGRPTAGDHPGPWLGVPGAVECDRLVNAAGLIGLGGRQVSVGQHHAGQQVTIRLDTQLAHVILDGVLVKTMPSPLPASALAHLQGARPATSPLRAPQGPTLVQRRVSSQGDIQVTGQKLQVGKTHAATTVTVLVYDRHFEILDGPAPIKTIPRHTTREVTRFKAYDAKPINDQGCQASTEP
jgi:transposase InsO family protein